MQVRIDVQGELFLENQLTCRGKTCKINNRAGGSFFVFSIMLSHYPILVRPDTVSEHPVLFQNFIFWFRKVIELGNVLGIFLKNIKHAGQNRRVGGIFFLKINKRAGQNKAVQWGFFPQN